MFTQQHTPARKTRKTSRPGRGVRYLAHSAIIAVLCAAGAPSAAAQQLNDSTISGAVEHELVLDHAVSTSDVDVRVVDGVATLSGTTDNILAKERAELIAETVKGVRSVINLIDVKPPEDRSDTEIKSDVRTALLSDPATDSYELSVAVKDGIVTLSGTVESWAEKRISGSVAKGVKGVVGLKNNIKIEYPRERLDSEIKPEIEKALRWDVLVDDALITVDVDKGHVTLAGTVGSAAEKRRVEYVAWVTGVTSIDTDGLEVARWARDSDLRTDKYVTKSADEVKDAVKDALLYDPRVLSFNITPEVTGSMVTLKGEVDNLKAARAAEDVARNTVGVTLVRNELNIRPTSDIADATIAQDIRDALLRNPAVDKYEISVGVTDGMAYLDGTVDSYYEKRVADDLASAVNGVVTVVNNLHVDDPAPLVYEPYIYRGYFYDYDWYDYEPIDTEMTDTQIKDEIKDEMWWSPFIDADDVTVSIDDGVATLTGAVDSVSEYHAAVENAYEGGATWVDNNLIIQTE